MLCVFILKRRSYVFMDSHENNSQPCQRRWFCVAVAVAAEERPVFRAIQLMKFRLPQYSVIVNRVEEAVSLSPDVGDSKHISDKGPVTESALKGIRSAECHIEMVECNCSEFAAKRPWKPSLEMVGLVPMEIVGRRCT